MKSKDGFQTGEVRVHRIDPEGGSSQVRFPLPPQEGKFDVNKIKIIYDNHQRMGAVQITRPLKDSPEAHQHVVEIGTIYGAMVVRPLMSNTINVVTGQQTGVKIELMKGHSSRTGGRDPALLVTLPTANGQSPVLIPITDTKGAPIPIINWKELTEGGVTNIHLTVGRDGQFYPLVFRLKHSENSPQPSSRDPVLGKFEVSKGKKPLNGSETTVILKEVGAAIKIYKPESQVHQNPNGLQISSGSSSTSRSLVEVGTGAP